MVDILGLTNDSSLGVEPDLEGVGVKGHHRFDPDWVLGQRPDLVVLGNGVLDGFGAVPINPWERSLYSHPTFRADYVPIRIGIPGDRPLLLWMRADSSLPRGASLAR